MLISFPLIRHARDGDPDSTGKLQHHLAVAKSFLNFLFARGPLQEITHLELSIIQSRPGLSQDFAL
jgi:hypothetical protein